LILSTHSFTLATDARWNSNENCTSTLALENASFLGLDRCYPKFGKTENCTYIQTAATQYWERFVLNLTEGGLGEPGNSCDAHKITTYGPTSHLCKSAVVGFNILRISL
jgi:hypothetical protein